MSEFSSHAYLEGRRNKTHLILERPDFRRTGWLTRKAKKIDTSSFS